MKSMRRWLLPLLLVNVVVLTACGGSDGYWDEFQPRTPTVQDLENKTFEFRDFSYGAVFDPSLSITPTTLSLAAAQASAARYLLPFTVAARGESSAGTATLEASMLTLQFTQVSASSPFTTARPLTFDLSADLDDGRIQLRNKETGVSQTSAPR